MVAAFIRQLGAESGVQLNPLQDNSEMPTYGVSDQVFGIVGRFSRGRIDKAFTVDRGNILKKLGRGGRISDSQLNEAYVHVYEAVNNGAYQAVVVRLSTDKAKVKWAVVRLNEDKEIEFSIEEEPTAPYLFALKHLECFNDGIRLEVYAPDKHENGVTVPTDVVSIRLLDSKNVLLYEITGSINRNALDDFQQTSFLPDLIKDRTDTIEIDVGVSVEDAIIPIDANFYGWDKNGKQRRIRSDILYYFDEGGTAYTTDDYARCRELLQYSTQNYAYISSGGSRSTTLLTQLAQLCYDTNRQFRFDVPGELDVDGAIAFVNQLNFGSNEAAEKIHAFWTIFQSKDPSGINPVEYLGTATLNIAMACARNAVKNGYGFAKKQQPIAGRDYPIRRAGCRQERKLQDSELNRLALAKINVVCHDSFTGGEGYLFKDTVTLAPVENSLKKLIAVADMSAQVDDDVTRFCKDILQKDMLSSVEKMNTFLRDYFEAIYNSGWLASKPTVYGATPNKARPYDLLDVTYSLHYTGTVRQIHVTQTLSRE